MCGLYFGVRFVILNKIILSMLPERAFTLSPSTGEFWNQFFFNSSTIPGK